MSFPNGRPGRWPGCLPAVPPACRTPGRFGRDCWISGWEKFSGPRPACRRQGIAGKIVAALEQHAAASGCHRAVLETGADMPEAIAFYEKQGYHLVPNYGDFAGDEVCVCMEKEISDGTMR